MSFNGFFGIQIFLQSLNIWNYRGKIKERHKINEFFNFRWNQNNKYTTFEETTAHKENRDAKATAGSSEFGKFTQWIHCAVIAHNLGD